MRHKLIRDLLKGTNSSWGAVTTRRVVDDAEHKALLREKLVEEANEVARATTHPELIEELADLYEVMETIRRLENVSRFALMSVAEAKRKAKGGFIRGLVMEQTGADTEAPPPDLDCPHWLDPQFR